MGTTRMPQRWAWARSDRLASAAARCGKAWLWAGLALLMACGSDTTGPVASATPFWKLRLNHHAIAMALTPPYDTVQLRATPLNAAGLPIADTSATHYRVVSSNLLDPSAHVDAAGVLHADHSEVGMLVIASRTIGQLTLADTTYLNVNALPPHTAVDSFHFHPAASGGGAFFCTENQPSSIGYKCPLSTGAKLAVTVKDSFNTVIPNVPVYFSVTDSTIASITQTGVITKGVVVRQRLGHVMLYVEATIYGQSLRDSLPFTVVAPDLRCVYVRPTASTAIFDPGTITVVAGASVVWVNAFSGHTADVVFDTPAAVQSADSAFLATGFALGQVCSGIPGIPIFKFIRIPNDGAAGSIPPWPAVDSMAGQDGIGMQARTFPTAGMYPYHSAEYGTAGVVIVQPLPIQ